MMSSRHIVSVASDLDPDGPYLDAARAAILAVGWSRTTLTDIARRAGVSRMTLYRRWPDMNTMLADLMTREWGTTVAEAAVLTQDGEGDPLTRISEGVVAAVRALRANSLLRRIIDVDPELLLPYLLDRRGRSQDMVAEVLAGLVREGQRTGAIRSGDPEHLARAVLLAAHGFALSAHTMLGTAGDPVARDADVEHFDVELGNLVERYLRP